MALPLGEIPVLDQLTATVEALLLGSHVSLRCILRQSSQLLYRIADQIAAAADVAVVLSAEVSIISGKRKHVSDSSVPSGPRIEHIDFHKTGSRNFFAQGEIGVIVRLLPML